MKLITAKWCQPCRTVKGYINKHEMDVEIIDIEDQFDDVPVGVRGVPTLVTDDGVRVTGLQPVLDALFEINMREARNG